MCKVDKAIYAEHGTLHTHIKLGGVVKLGLPPTPSRAHFVFIIINIPFCPFISDIYKSKMIIINQRSRRINPSAV